MSGRTSLKMFGLLLLFAFYPVAAHSQFDCTNGNIGHTEVDLAEYVVKPWYPVFNNISTKNMKTAIEIISKRDYEEKWLEIPPEAPGDQSDDKNNEKKKSSGSLESDIILGLTDFIIERAKAEAIQLYMTELKKELCTDDYSYYFSNTCFMQSQSMETMPYLPGLVSAFRKDLEYLPSNIMCKNLQTDKGYYLTNIVKEVINGAPVEHLIAGLPEHSKIDESCSVKDKSACDLYITGLLAQTILGIKDDKPWDVLFKYFNAKLTNKGFNADDEDKTKKNILELARIFNDIDLQVRKIKKAKLEGNHTAIVVESATKISRGLIKIIYNPSVTKLACKEGDDKHNCISLDEETRNTMDALLNAVGSVSAGQYSEALLDINKIISVDYEKRLKDPLSKLKEKLISAQNRKITKGEFTPNVESCYMSFYALVDKPQVENDDTVQRLNNIIIYDSPRNKINKTKDIIGLKLSFFEQYNPFSDCKNEINKIVDELYPELIYEKNAVQKYLPTIASLATAKSSEDVKNILNETAASVGSWRLKQKKKTLSFGAMFGLQGGQEVIHNTNYTAAGGLFAPVGFDLTWPINQWENFDGWGIFFSMLDLGTVASTRIASGDEDSVKNKSENITLAQVLSPGGYLHIKYKKTPVNFGAGVSYVPILRTVDENGTKEDRGGTRVLGFVSIDLPMYFLY